MAEHRIDVVIDASKAEAGKREVVNKLGEIRKSGTKSAKGIDAVSKSLSTIKRISGGALGSVKRALESISSTAGRAGRAVASSIGKIESSGRRAIGILGSMRGILASLGLALGIAGLAGDAVEYQKQMSNVAAVTRATGKDFKALEKLATDMGKSTAFTASQAAEAQAFLGMAGFTTQQIMASLSDTLSLASAGSLSLAEAADIASNVLTAFGLSADNMGRIADVMAEAAARSNTNILQLGDAMKYAAPLSRGLGVSVEDATAAIGNLSNAGLQGEMAGTALRQTMTSLESPTKKARDTLSAYGLSAADVSVSTHGLIPVLRTLAGAGLKTADAFAIAGARGGNGLDVLIKSVDGVQDLSNKLDNAAGAAKRMADTKLDNIAGDLALLGSALQGAFNQFFFGSDGAVANAFRELIQGATAFAETLESTIRKIQDGSDDFTAWERVIKTVGGALAFLAGGTAIGAVIAGIRAIGLALAANPLGVILLIGGAVIANWDLFSGYLETAYDWIVDIAEKAMPRISAAIQVGSEILSAYGQVWTAVFNDILDWAKSVPGQVVAFFEGLWDKIYQAIIVPIDNAIDTVISKISGLFEFSLFGGDDKVSGGMGLDDLSDGADKASKSLKKLSNVGAGTDKVFGGLSLAFGKGEDKLDDNEKATTRTEKAIQNLRTAVHGASERYNELVKNAETVNAMKAVQAQIIGQVTAATKGETEAEGENKSTAEKLTETINNVNRVLTGHSSASDGATKSTKKLTDAQEKLKDIVEETRTPIEKLRKELEDVEKLRPLADTAEEIEAIDRKVKQLNTDIGDEGEKAANKWLDSWKGTSSAISSLIDGFIGDALNGLGSFGKIASGFISDLIGQATGGRSLGESLLGLVFGGSFGSPSGQGSIANSVAGQAGNITAGASAASGFARIFAGDFSLDAFLTGSEGFANFAGEVGNFISDGLGGAFSDAASALTSPIGSIGSVGANLLLNSILGDRGIGSTIGSTIGSIAGSFLGPFGTIAGSALGNLIGGLFGPGKSVGPNTSSVLTALDGNVSIAGLGGDNGGEEFIDQIKQVSDSVSASLNEIAKATGSTISSGLNIGFANFESQGGFLSRVGNDERSFGSDQEAAVADLVRRSILTYFIDLPENVKSALQSIERTTVDELIKDIDFAQNFDDAIAAMNGGVKEFSELVGGEVKAQIDSAVSSVTDFRNRTSELGLDVDRANDATKHYVETIVGIADPQSAETLSAVAAEWYRIQAIQDNMAPLLQAVGISSEDAIAGLDKLRNELKNNFSKSLEETYNEVTGRGAINELNALVDKIAQLRSDADLIGASDSDLAKIDTIFAKTVEQILSSSELSSDILNEIASTFSDFPTIVDAVNSAIADTVKVVDTVTDTVIDSVSQVDIFRQNQIAAEAYAREQAANKELEFLESQKSVIEDGIDRAKDLSDTFRSLGEDLIKAANSLNLSDAAGLSNIALLEETRSQFRSTRDAALRGNENALRDLPGISEKYLSASRDFYQGNEEFERDKIEIQKALRDSGSQALNVANNQERVLNESLTQLQKIEQAISEQNEILKTAQREQNQDFGSNPDLNRALAREFGYTGDFRDGLFQQFIDRTGQRDALNNWTYPGFASGGAFENSVVMRPSVFSMADIGENGPEGILPLRRMPNGDLGVSASNDEGITSEQADMLIRQNAKIIEILTVGFTNEREANEENISYSRRIANASGLKEAM